MFDFFFFFQWCGADGKNFADWFATKNFIFGRFKSVIIKIYIFIFNDCNFQFSATLTLNDSPQRQSSDRKKIFINCYYYYYYYYYYSYYYYYYYYYYDCLSLLLLSLSLFHFYLFYFLASLDIAIKRRQSNWLMKYISFMNTNKKLKLILIRAKWNLAYFKIVVTRQRHIN